MVGIWIGSLAVRFGGPLARDLGEGASVRCKGCRLPGEGLPAPDRDVDIKRVDLGPE
jgi:hypothetical protein